MTTQSFSQRAQAYFAGLKMSTKALLLTLLEEQERLNSLTVDATVRAALHVQLRALWTYHSNALEGNRLTLGDTVFTLQKGLTIKDKPFKDHLDVLHHAQAIDFLMDVMRDRIPITPQLLGSLNKILVNGQSVNQLGDGGEAMPALASEAVSDLCGWLQEQSHALNPIAVAALAHHECVRIQPFQDGNGRGARLLMNLILLRHGLFPTIIHVEDRKEYLRVLKKAGSGDLGPWVMFLAEQTAKTQSIARKTLEGEESA